MLFVRLLMFLMLPVRLPFMLLARLVRGGRATATGAERAGQAVGGPAATGAARPLGKHSDLVDVRYGVFFKIFTCPESDEPSVGPNDTDMAQQMASKAQQFYKVRADLFPPDDIFYEQVEGSFVDQVTRIDNDGGKDQFVDTLDKARRITNDNTRTLFCELTPLVLLIALLINAAMLVFDPFHLLDRRDVVWTLQGAQVFAIDLALIGVALGVSVLVVACVYWLSYTHIQRANALSLNVFITNEFARLNNAFRIAQREALQAETQLADTQKDEIKRLAGSWTLAYHWVGVRQFIEEMFVRNNMFQIRRNTTLYRALGVVVCLLFLGVTLGGFVLAASFFEERTPVWAAVLYLSAVTLGFCLVSYGLTMRRPFSIVATALMKDQWYRYDTLAVGDAIAEQVTRDKVQIVINRDRARAAGV